MKRLALLICFLFLNVSASSQIANPRHPAEWEEVSGIVMEADIQMAFPTLWDEAIDPFIKVAQACIDEEVDLYVIDPDTGGSYGTRFVNMDTVFSNRGLVSPRIHVIHVNHPFDEFPWARDHGPYTIYENQVGAIYFGGYDGDSLAAFFAQYIGENFIHLPRVSNDITYYDGGNWVTDGHGTFNICNTHGSQFPNGLVRPPITPFHDYLGIAQTLNVSGVDIHADYWLKPINEETFVIGYLPPSNYVDDPLGYRNSQAFIDSGVTDIKAYLQSAFGRNFKFYPIQNAPSFDDVTINTTYVTESASYTNSLIINKTVLVPQFTYQPYDSLALITYRNLMPGYNVIGVNCRQYAVGAGALHCITREIYADNPIYIKHTWLPDSLNKVTDYQIDAVIMSTGGIATVSLFWTTDTSSGFSEVAMTATGNDNYRALIPGQNYGTTINYYITATNNNGKTISKPLVAPDGYFRTLIDPDGVTGMREKPIAGLIPQKFSLSQNYPNPFNPQTTIRYGIPKSGHVELKIFNIQGQLVRTLADEIKPAGSYQAIWNGRNDDEILQASGVYFYRLRAEDFIKTKRMLLLR